MFRWSVQTRLSILIFYVIAAQIMGKYYSHSYLVFRTFDTLKFGLILLGPLVLGLSIFGWSREEMGLCLPKIKVSRIKLILGLIGIFILIPFVFREVLQSDTGYLSYYGFYRQSSVPFLSRLQDFSIFTVSTLIGWEVFHRSFLLFGLKNLWEEAGLNVKIAERSALLVTLGFETLYHLLKPSMEAWGMLLFSPILSLIALKTRSILIPLLLHLFVEFLFFWAITS